MQTLFTGKPAIHLARVNSTNTYLKTLCAREPVNEGFAVIAAEQTQGAGQRGKTWLSPPGENLLCSVFLKPRFLAPERGYLLNMVCASAVAAWLAEQSVSAKIKWPNDIYIQNKKCAGILIENRIKSSEIAHSIIGLGLNLNQTQFIGKQVANATSPALTVNKKFNINNVFSRYCELLESKYLTAKTNPEKLISAFNKQLWGTDRFNTFINQKGETLELKTLKVTAQGALYTTTINGNILIFKQNELHLLLNNSDSLEK